MAVYFVDSSALVKRYISEIGSTWVLSLFDPALDNDILIAAITGVEIVAAIIAVVIKVRTELIAETTTYQ